MSDRIPVGPSGGTLESVPNTGSVTGSESHTNPLSRDTHMVPHHEASG